MCGRFACSLCPDDVSKYCGIKDRNGTVVEPKWKEDSHYEYKPFYNGPPTTTIPVVVYDNKQGEENYHLVAMKWGFTPNFPVNPQVLAHSHNARVENILVSKMYKNTLTTQRCVILAEGFYEWQTTAGAGNKQPHFIYQNPKEKEEDPPKHMLKMAGLWTTHKAENGSQKYSCTVITTESDKSFSWLHHRMPIILSTQDEINNWLDCDKVHHDKILPELQRSFTDRAPIGMELKHYTVDKSYVNKATCDDPKCMIRAAVKRPNTLDAWLTGKKKK